MVRRWGDVGGDEVNDTEVATEDEEGWAPPRIELEEAPDEVSEGRGERRTPVEIRSGEAREVWEAAEDPAVSGKGASDDRLSTSASVGAFVADRERATSGIVTGGDGGGAAALSVTGRESEIRFSPTTVRPLLPDVMVVNDSPSLGRSGLVLPGVVSNIGPVGLAEVSCRPRAIGIPLLLPRPPSPPTLPFLGDAPPLPALRGDD